MTLVTDVRPADEIAPDSYTEPLNAEQEAERCQLANACRALDPANARYHCNPDRNSLRRKLIGLLERSRTAHKRAELLTMTNDALIGLSEVIVEERRVAATGRDASNELAVAR